jgi:hypothetical protein
MRGFGTPQKKSLPSIKDDLRYLRIQLQCGAFPTVKSRVRALLKALGLEEAMAPYMVHETVFKDGPNGELKVALSTRSGKLLGLFRPNRKVFKYHSEGYSQFAYSMNRRLHAKSTRLCWLANFLAITGIDKSALKPLQRLACSFWSIGLVDLRRLTRCIFERCKNVSNTVVRHFCETRKVLRSTPVYTGVKAPSAIEGLLLPLWKYRDRDKPGRFSNSNVGTGI